MLESSADIPTSSFRLECYAQRLYDITNYMRRMLLAVSSLVLSAASLVAQGKPVPEKRLWVLRSPGEMVEYDPSTFVVKQTIKIPAEAAQSPQAVAVNRLEQILYVPTVSLPLIDNDVPSSHKLWLWDGRAAATIGQGVKREVATTGSNQAVTEVAPAAYLSADGQHLFWFANQSRRLQRENVDLSITTTWQAWRTDTGGENRQDLATLKLPDCSCETGACEESCPYGVVWVPENGVDKFFLITQFVAGQTETTYKASTRYLEEGGKWTANSLAEPLKRVLDATSDGNTIVEAIPDTGCCGWVNESDDQTRVLSGGKARTVFDERATYKNPDYDVSFYTSTARLSPELGYVAMTIVATAEANQPIQLADEGQANPEESKQIRAALAELPAVEVKSLEDSPRRVAFLTHATLVGWLSERDILIVEDHMLVTYNVSTGTRRKSSVRVEDAAHVFLR
jgi:hypothetical protein